MTLPAPNLDQLFQNFIAVHATSIFPEKGLLKCGGVYRKEGEMFFTNGDRRTIHWALGSLVKPHARGNWEEMPYAVVVRLGDLAKCLLNVSPYDTFTGGDFPLNGRTIFIAPEGTKPPLDQVKMVNYRKGEKIRDVINRVLVQEGGWQVKLDTNVYLNSEAHLDRFGDVNTPEFFRPLLDQCPYLSFGTHVYSLEGEMWRYGVTEEIFHLLKNVYLLFPWFKGFEFYLTPKLFREDLDFLIFYLVHQKNKLEQLLERFTEPLKELRPNLQQIESWLFILKLDIEMGLKLGRSSSQETGEWMMALQKALLSKDRDFKETVAEAKRLTLISPHKDSSTNHVNSIQKSAYCFQMSSEEINTFFALMPHYDILAHFFTLIVRLIFKNDEPSKASLDKFLESPGSEDLEWMLTHHDYDFIHGTHESQLEQFEAYLKIVFTAPKYKGTLSHVKALLESITEKHK